jgi:hypothetical protein
MPAAAMPTGRPSVDGPRCLITLISSLLMPAWLDLINYDEVNGGAASQHDGLRAVAGVDRSLTRTSSRCRRSTPATSAWATRTESCANPSRRSTRSARTD